MIFVSCGTNEAPFDRLTKAATELPDAPLLVQYGSSRVTTGPGEWRDYLSFEEMEAAMREARTVVVHAGVGSILLALRCGRHAVVMPRRSGEEAVDDHQVALALRLQAAGLVTVVDDVEALLAACASGDAASGAAPPARADAGNELAADLRGFLAAANANAAAPRRRAWPRRRPEPVG